MPSTPEERIAAYRAAERAYHEATAAARREFMRKHPNGVTDRAAAAADIMTMRRAISDAQIACERAMKGAA